MGYQKHLFSFYEIVASSGIEINFKENGNIISYSPLKFIGEKNDPILIKNINGKGGNELLL